MSTTIALLLAAFMNAQGTPAKAIEVSHDKSIVILEGRPGCTAEPLNGDFRSPVVTCRSVSRR